MRLAPDPFHAGSVASAVREPLGAVRIRTARFYAEQCFRSNLARAAWPSALRLYRACLAR